MKLRTALPIFSVSLMTRDAEGREADIWLCVPGAEPYATAAREFKLHGDSNAARSISALRRPGESILPQWLADESRAYSTAMYKHNLRNRGGKPPSGPPADPAEGKGRGKGRGKNKGKGKASGRGAA